MEVCILGRGWNSTSCCGVCLVFGDVFGCVFRIWEIWPRCCHTWCNRRKKINRGSIEPRCVCTPTNKEGEKTENGRSGKTSSRLQNLLLLILWGESIKTFTKWGEIVKDWWMLQNYLRIKKAATSHTSFQRANIFPKLAIIYLLDRGLRERCCHLQTAWASRCPWPCCRSRGWGRRKEKARKEKAHELHGKWLDVQSSFPIGFADYSFIFFDLTSFETTWTWKNVVFHLKKLSQKWLEANTYTRIYTQISADLQPVGFWKNKPKYKPNEGMHTPAGCTCCIQNTGGKGWGIGFTRLDHCRKGNVHGSVISQPAGVVGSGGTLRAYLFKGSTCVWKAVTVAALAVPGAKMKWGRGMKKRENGVCSVSAET